MERSDFKSNISSKLSSLVDKVFSLDIVKTGLSKIPPNASEKILANKKPIFFSVCGAVFIICLLMLGIVFFGGSRTPDQVALEVVAAMHKGTLDASFFRKNCYGSESEFLEVVNLAKENKKPNGDQTFTVAKMFVDDDVATVVVKDEGGENTCFLRKLDGEWKYHASVSWPGEGMISEKTVAALNTAFNKLRKEHGGQDIKRTCTDNFIEKHFEWWFGDKQTGWKIKFHGRGSVDDRDYGKGKITGIAEGTEKPEKGKQYQKQYRLVNVHRYVDVQVKRVDGVWKFDGDIVFGRNQVVISPVEESLITAGDGAIMPPGSM